MFHLSLQSASIFLDYSVSACSLMAASLSLPSSLRLPSSTLFLFKQPTLLSAPITKSITFFPPFKHRLHRTQHSQLNSFQFNAGPNDGRSNPPSMGRELPELRRTLFPGGYKRSEIKIPSIVLQLSAEEVLDDGSVLGVVDNLVSKWVGIVVLAAGDGGGGKLYKAACLLKSVIRDRAYLLISERVDIASAVAAGGVVLSDQGLPAIVARNSMLDSKSETVHLPIVGRSVRSVDAAVSASNSEGADFLIFSTIMEELSVQQLQSISTSVKIPIFVALTDPLSLNKASSILQSGASGLIIRLEEFMLFSDETLTTLLCETIKTTSRRQDKLQSFANQQEVGGVTGVVKLDDAEVKFVKKEKRVLTEAIDVIQKAAPLMEEVSLLNDAVDQLDEPFLLVIVGEFNSGKSSVVNALLGGRFLKEGVIPTTNEITFLRYSELSSGGQQQCERHPDGQYICYLPAEILKEMIIVDTPGTNVILQRQQRLTEEFVPRADLLLFVISADRPLTESEVTFLRYTQQWKKNVVFILNKSDLYRNRVELEEGVKFVKENVCQLLNTENVMLYPVSARSALEAKLLSSEVGRVHEELVMTEQTITTRSFYEFEKFLYGLLDGSTPVGLERKKMKLETPIRIAERLLSSCQTLVTQECRYANQELTTLSNLIDGVKEYAKKMESDSLSWRKNILSMIDATTGRATKLLDSTLQLSNVELGASLIIRGEKSSLSDAALTIQNDIVNPALSDAQKLLEEYGSWLHENNAREGQQYKASFEKKMSHLIADHPDGMAKLDLNLLLRGEGDKLGVKAIEKLGNNDVSKLFEEEIREVFLGAFGGLGAAGLSASLLTSVLPTTMEDLLALGLCSLGGYVAISNFPARKQKTIEKVKRIGDTVRVEIEEAMLKDLRMTTERMESFVQQVGKPYQEAAQARVDKLLEIQDELTTVEKKLRSLQMELQNLRLS